MTYHAGEVGVAFSAVTASATGGTAPYVWGTSGGALPPGMAMSFDGTLSGTPTTAGTYSFILVVEDANKQIGAASKVVNVAPPLSLSAACARLCSVEQGCVTVCGSLGSINGGARPFKVSLLNGGIPKGMNLVPLALTGGFPTTGDFSFTVLVTDAVGVSGTVGANFHVFSHIFMGGDISTSCVGYGCELRIPWSPGTPNATPTLSISNVVCLNSPGVPHNSPTGSINPNFGPCNGQAGNPQQGLPPEPPPNTLPSGFSAVVSGGEVVIDFSSPGSTGDWFGTFNITLTDVSPCTASSNCSTTLTISVDNWTGYG